MSKVWSLTPFFNEIDVLEIRLAELDPVVDVHVIAEATRTFSGDEKPLYFEREKWRFERWRDKIRYVVVDDMPAGDDAIRPSALFNPSTSIRWRRENMQRQALIRGCEGMNLDDLVLLSDVDEIPAAHEVARADGDLEMGEIWRTKLPQHVMYLNWRWHEPATIAICRFTDGGTFMRLGPQKLREHDAPEAPIHGWHFSYMGGAEMIRHKIFSAAHAELARPRWVDLDRIRDRMERGHDMFGRLDRTCIWVPNSQLPGYVQENTKRFEHMLIPNPAEAR